MLEVEPSVAVRLPEVAEIGQGAYRHSRRRPGDTSLVYWHRLSFVWTIGEALCYGHGNFFEYLLNNA